MSDFIPKEVDIIAVAKHYGAEPKREGSHGYIQTRVNPLRIERTSSLVLYPATNTFHDFGTNEGGDACDMVMLIEGCGFKEAIQKLKDMSGFADLNYIPRRAPMIQNEYMKPEIVAKIFNNKMKPIDIEADYISEVVPQYAIDHLRNNPSLLKDFAAKLRFDPILKTLTVGIYDDGKIIGFRYRKKTFADGEVRKWVPEKGMRSAVPYLNECLGDFTIVVEGTHDFVTADAMGLSCIGLPYAGFKLDAKHIEGKRILFMPDNDKAGREGMEKTIAHCGGSGVIFDHAKFAKDNGIGEEKDFSDYAFRFSDLQTFVAAIEKHMEEVRPEKPNINNLLRSANKHITRESLEQLDDVDWMIDGLIPKGLITAIVGDGGSGKTSAMLAMANKAFDEDRIDHLIVFDADMSPKLLKSRLLTLMDRNGDESITYYSHSITDTAEMEKIIQTLTNSRVDGTRIFVIIDTLKDFVTSPNDEKDIQRFMTILKSLRDQTGATIALLHHTKKRGSMEKDLTYTGSNAINGSVDQMTYLWRDGDTVFFKHGKNRQGADDKAYRIDKDRFEIEEAEFVEFGETEGDNPKASDAEYAEIIHKTLREKGEMVQDKIYEATDKQVPKSRINKILGAYLGKKFTYEKLIPKGKKWRAVNSGPTEVVYEMPSSELF